ncbi:hypothetical protein OVA07_07845 [Novosphingobium sp. SL115]|uniref:hypothetical protein n=1 Tax=Novosphingobium sp. SL115 TaxID=2995150 RepID=UPI0022754FDD|nr:hypothetical protein [Novosphingobium sp. SL115]MCY1670927.1 hypothetical protein [Novosphingobium sp. SL115]
MTERSSDARKVVARRAYARPNLTIYGSVRELTGAMSATGSDMMAMLMAGEVI